MVGSAEEFLALPRRMIPSCVLAELDLPGLSGVDLQRLLLGRTEMPLILMSERVDVRTAVRVMKQGAFEVLTKPLVADVWLSAIGDAIDRSCAVLANFAELRDLEERYASLTSREREVMNLVASGRLNKQVGAELGISEITVKAHRGRMMHKMQASSLAELVTMASSLRFAPSQSRGIQHASLENRYVSSSGTATGVLTRGESRGWRSRSTGTGTRAPGSHPSTPSAVACLHLESSIPRAGSTATRKGSFERFSEPKHPDGDGENDQSCFDHRSDAQTLTRQMSQLRSYQHTWG
jgi:FixJ family two-component response regulator